MADLRRTEELTTALGEMEARYRCLADHSPLGVGVVGLLDDDLWVVSINGVGAAHFASHPKDVEGRRFSELGYGAGELQGIVAKYREAERTGGPVRFEQEVSCAPRPPRHLEVTLWRIDAPGPTRICAIADDVTGQKRLAAPLPFSEHLASVSALAAGIAHEVNNPLAYVMGNMTFVLEEITRHLARIDTAGSASVLADGETTELRDGLLKVSRAIADAQGGAERIRQIVKSLRIIAQRD
jgi:signal transduction histidine kinase